MLEVRSFLHQFLESFEFFSIDLKIEFKFPVKGGEDLLSSLQGTSHNRINTNNHKKIIIQLMSSDSGELARRAYSVKRMGISSFGIYSASHLRTHEQSSLSFTWSKRPSEPKIMKSS